jgi:uncharacterized protein (TIRG00374 family)
MPTMAEPRDRAADRRRVAMRWALRLVGPMLLVVVLARLPDRSAIGRALGRAELAPLGLALLLTFANLELKIVRWQVLLRTRGFQLTQAQAWPAFLSSSYVALLTPGHVGDVLRVQYLRHGQNVPVSEGLASVVMDRFCDLYVLCAFVAVGVARFGAGLLGELWLLAWAAVGLTVLGPLVLLVPGVSDRALRAVVRRIWAGREQGGTARFLQALRANVGRSLLVTLPLTAMAFGINYLQGWLMGHALGLELGMLDVVSLMAIASLLALLPISISGVGVRELFFSLAFPALGLTGEQGVSFGLLVLVAIYLAMALVGFVSFQLAPPPTGPKTTPEGPGEPRTGA